jgi:hypothetical protein
MALTLTSISPEKAHEPGGDRLTIFGDFSSYIGQKFLVFIGPNGDITDEPAYSAIPEQGAVLYPRTESFIWCYLPTLDEGVYNVYVRLEDGSQDGLLANAIEIFKPQYYDTVFKLRRLYSPHFLVGPRTPADLSEV